MYSCCSGIIFLKPASTRSCEAKNAIDHGDQRENDQHDDAVVEDQPLGEALEGVGFVGGIRTRP